MKKTVIGAYVQENPSMGWRGNRFRASAVDRGAAVPMAAALLLPGLRLAMLGAEYFRKEK